MFEVSAPVVIAARTALSRLVAWAGRRARERSTYTGLALLAGALGYHELGVRIDNVADALALLGLVSGAGLVTATTSQHPPAPLA